jgi:hypothetical protein
MRQSVSNSPKGTIDYLCDMPRNYPFFSLYFHLIRVRLVFKTFQKISSFLLNSSVNVTICCHFGDYECVIIMINFLSSFCYTFRFNEIYESRFLQHLTSTILLFQDDVITHILLYRYKIRWNGSKLISIWDIFYPSSLKHIYQFLFSLTFVMEQFSSYYYVAFSEREYGFIKH